MNSSLMEYLPPVAPQTPPGHGADKYHGAVAAGYDAKRETSAKWIVEQAIIEGWLGDLAAGTEIIDIPAGTGRFFDCYQRHGHKVVAVDRSMDMLQEAGKKVRMPDSFRFGTGDITNMNRVPDKVFDVAVSCRVTRWVIGEFGPDGIVRMLKELQRVTRSKIIVTARVANHRFAVSLDLIESALDGWRISRNAVGADMDYRILMLEPV